MSVDYKNTVFLPKTDFPMKGELPKLEPELLARWEKIDLFGRLRATAKGREKFILHDGPPYANGNLHIGHALNKILKDVITRSQQMLGKDADYVPGWDCHGLPIEWKIEEKYRDAGKDKDEIDIVTFREECRQFAAKWIGIQKEEFKRLGITGDWDHPYTTMTNHAESVICAELGKFLLDGSLYKGAKPVLWSVVEKTALAEAEVEYHDHTSITIWVKFPVVSASTPELDGAKVVIWTTTPWTMPGNRAVAYGAAFDYVVVEVESSDSDLAKVGEKLVLCADLAEQVAKDAKCSFKTLHTLKGSALAGTIAHHPLKFHEKAAGGYDFEVPLLAGGFVTTDTGTGFVHIAPGHGEDDWHLGKEHGIAIPDTVQPDGKYFPHVAIFAGMDVLNQGKNGKYYSPVAKPVIEAMSSVGNLLAHGKVEHSYPHSWRSKAPLIFRNTPQWFISMEATGLRAKALQAIADTRFVPDQGRNRIGSMVENRPDWCVSRQRAWGVPITVFVDKKTGQPLRDQAVMDRIVEAFKAEGSDAWFTSPPERFLGPDRDPADYDKVTDILDVWFDSGCTHAFVLEGEEWPRLSWPASLYLEGSDQHRGWFHSSVLESCGTRGRAPYDAVLTHGFVLDEDGRKMSKSLGNVVAPQEVVGSMGADILRLWVVGSDYSDDLRIGPEILKTQVDIYRRLRNTLRYLLGALDGFTEAERVDPKDMPELERWVLHRLSELDVQFRDACNGFQFHGLFTELHNFCAVDLSAFYFDIRKDALYCDAATSLRRRAARTVFDILLDTLAKWLAPFLCFTAEQAWLARHPSEDGSVHLELFPEIPAFWRDDALAAKWAQVREVRKVVTGALEIERREKRIGSSLQANPKVYVERTDQFPDNVDWAEVCITSGLELSFEDFPADAFRIPELPTIAVTARNAEGEKCQRCWKVLPEVGSAKHEGVCHRCSDAVEAG
ncbi:Isoleucyl-tRNA synthetase [Paramagnetospirillum magnetotacticum MS-1]|uniref:Isoleucine--tRNA ligase n=1 Tax=Paramagnetospirillum magnetotacticum MS-1 TaxID=272627 RepID=A0A0C2YQZ0_PARME|nr:isoleucine--tRNA ligase [Paramagnetospirillum magnetotacticum]KIL97085.1 Isoleucyl-tRNA synthetase [Paramagnetospirillum magnetotacticum MS-1]